MLWLPILGLIIGLLVGMTITFSVPVEYAPYIFVIILVFLDSAIGGYKAFLERQFNKGLLLSGLIFNILLCVALIYLGNKLDIELYLVAVMIFAYRIISNFGSVRRIIAVQNHKRKKQQRLAAKGHTADEKK